MHPTLSLDAVTKSYGATMALRDVGLVLDAGRIHALMGENGAGKSTLLGVLSGGVRADRGSMAIDGEPVALGRYSPARARAMGVSIVHQEFSLVPDMTVAENIFLGQERHRGPVLSRRETARQAQALLDRVRSTVSPDARVSTLGIADAQLVEVAKALASNAKILALDEPSAVLSGSELSTLFEIVRSVAADGVAILYVSHRMDEVFMLCDDYTVLKDGAVSDTGRIADTTADDLIRKMVGRSVSTDLRGAARAPGAERLRLQDFQVEGLAPIDLSLRAGEIVGLSGLQGSGRSRLARGIFGDVRVTGGAIHIDGVERAPFRRPIDAMVAGLAYVPEDRKTMGLALTKSVSMNALMLTWSRLRSRVGWISRTKERERIGEVITSFSIKTSPDGQDAARELSGGNQQKVLIAKWLELEPRVVIFDEPTRGVDVGSKEQIYEVIRALASSGATVLLVSSELIEILGLADRILVMADGRVVGELDGPTADEEQIMQLITSASRQDVA